MSNSIFVVAICAGTYEDKWEKVVRAFSSRDEAQRFIDRKNRAISEVEGMERAKRAMMQEWEKSHPCPDYDTSTSEEREVWRGAKWEEEDRLSQVLGLEKAWEETGAGIYSNDYARYFINEVPLDGDPWQDV